MVLYRVCFALQMVAVEKNQPATIQNANEAVRDVPKLSEWRSAVLNPFVQQGSFSPTAEETGRISMKFCTSENFLLYGIWCRAPLKVMSTCAGFAYM